MLFTWRALPSTLLDIFIVVSIACMASSLSNEMCSTIPRPPSCDCSNTTDGYELRCSAFTVQVKPKAVVHIQCDNNVVSDFSVLSGIRISEVDTLINTCLYANEFLRLFMNNSDLETVKLYDNTRTLKTMPSRMLADLSNLKVVRISNGNMSILPENFLWGSTSIHTVSLNNNAFITLPEMLFKDCTKLESLDISYNRITDLPNKIFSSVNNLKCLKINNNQLSVITIQLFSPLRNLMVLDLKDNRLSHVETLAFEMLSSLKAVNLSNNLLAFDGTDLSPLKHCLMLENIQLANNSLIRIFPDWRRLKNLETLNLAYNKISQMASADLQFVSSKDIYVNVSYNNISETDIFHNWREGSSQFSKYHNIINIEPWRTVWQLPVQNLPVRHIFIEGNFIKCDCKVPRLILPNETTIYEIVMKNNPENMQCAKRVEYRDIVLEFLQPKYVTCLLEKAYSLNCPEECTCLLMSSNETLLVDCNQRNLTSMATRDTMHNLSRSVFAGTHNLQILAIDSIKMRSLPSNVLLDLTELRYINLFRNEFLSLPQNLFVNNRKLVMVNIINNKRTLSTLPLGLLGNLSNLHDVTLRGCNTSILPEDLLWGSQSIRFISLTRNAFTALPKQLFKDCLNLQKLDISYNRITDLPTGLFSEMKYLDTLKINNNQLSIIPNNFFSSLWHLIVLDLKDNRLKHIESKAFIELQNLRSLDMSNNLLTFRDSSQTGIMSPLKFCDVLEDLQLANNTAEDLHFIGVQNTFVNISYNNISEMDIFENKRVSKYVSETAVYNVPVRHYFIEGNRINCDCKVYRFLQFDEQDVTTEIKITTGTNTSSLQCVKLEAYTGQVFQKIPIKYFTCLLKTQRRLNCPEACSCRLFPTTKTMVVDCHQSNLLSTPARVNMMHNLSKDIFFNAHNLESLEIKWNRMICLPQDLFLDLINLRKISIYANKFQSLPQNLFVNNTNLEKVNIENNGVTLKTLPSRFLASLTKLREVKLNSCNTSYLPENLLWGSTSINTISLKNNALTTLPEQLFDDCSELQTLDISFNRITDLPQKLFYNTRNLKALKINNNELSILRGILHLNYLEILDLKYNRLIGLEYGSSDSVPSIKVVDLSNNILTNMPWSFFDSYRNLEDIQLANNSLTEFPSYFASLDNLQTLNLAHNKISQLSGGDFIFDNGKDIFVNLSYNNIVKIDIFEVGSTYKYIPVTGKFNVPKMHFFMEGNPINCDCKAYSFLQYSDDKMANIVTAEVKLAIGTEPSILHCVNPKGDTEEQNENIPIKHFTCLFEEGFSLNCPEECSCLFRTSDKALRVDCQVRNLTSMPRALPDVEFSNYTVLNLSENRIKSVTFLSGPGYNKVTEYILSHNMISEIDLTAFPLGLQVLQLDGNSITQFNDSSIDVLKNFTSLTKLTLHNNPWRCDCTTQNFVTLIQSTYQMRKIKFMDKFKCNNGTEILKLLTRKLCPAKPQIAIFVSYAVAALGLLIGFLLAAYYKFKNGIKIWLYVHRCCLWFVNEDELDRGKLYDAFVSYAHQDEEFVLDELVPRLEADQYTLCLHQRDWMPGEFIPAQIARSVEDSRRTIIVLSSAFLESAWSRLEFCAAHKQSLSEGRVRLIMIMYGEIGPIDNLDPELRSYITMNTYVKWGDRWFWENLRYAMPHNLKDLNEIQLQPRA